MEMLEPLTMDKVLGFEDDTPRQANRNHPQPFFSLLNIIAPASSSFRQQSQRLIIPHTDGSYFR